MRGEVCGGYRDVATLAFRSENLKVARKCGPATTLPSRDTGGKEFDIGRDDPLSTLSLEDQAVSSFFDKFVIAPTPDGSCPGFLEHLPGLFKEVNLQGRYALRWAVLAAAYASLSKDNDIGQLGDTALDCYGRALNVLGKSLADSATEPDDYILMAIVVLDLFEVGQRLLMGSSLICTLIDSLLGRSGFVWVPCRWYGSYTSSPRLRAISR